MHVQASLLEGCRNQRLPYRDKLGTTIFNISSLKIFDIWLIADDTFRLKATV